MAFCKWEVLHSAARTSSASAGGDERCTTSLLCPMWLSVLKCTPSGERGDPPAGLTPKWGTGRAAPSASPRWPSPGTLRLSCCERSSVQKRWAPVVLRFYSCMGARDFRVSDHLEEVLIASSWNLALLTSGLSRGWKARTDPQYWPLSQKQQSWVVISSVISFFLHCFEKIKNETVQMVLRNTCVSAQNKYEHM